jgi:hypothetical protein
MKKLLTFIGIIGLAAAVYAASSIYPTGSAGQRTVTVVASNINTLAKSSNGGRGTLYMKLTMTCLAEKTQGVSFVALTNGAALSECWTSIVTGAIASFPTAANPYVPGGGLYLIGDPANGAVGNVLYTNTLIILRE